MKGISSKDLLLPLTVVLLAVIIVTITSVNSVGDVKEQGEEYRQQLYLCREQLNNKTEQLDNVLARLNLTEKDIEKYDKIYSQKETEAEVLLNQLLEQEEELRESQNCPVPYRSVPTYEAYGIALHIEMLLERNRNTEEYMKSQEHLNEKQLKTIAGQLYFISLDFKNLFIRNGVRIKLDEKGEEWYLNNLEYLEELELYYMHFDEFNIQKLKTRLPQVLKLQKGILRGMQERYFI